MEGRIYTVIHIAKQVLGWLEIVPQALLSAGLCYWVNHPEKRWLNRVMVAVFVVTVILPVLGLLA